jgi:hypothetical protein
LTWAQDLGAVTELLSGAYFVPFGRSTSHQMWSSAMVITPAVRGLFGISFDAEHKTVMVDPHLPAEWEGATLHHLPVPGGTADLIFHRERGEMVVRLERGPDGVILKSKGAASARAASPGELRITLPAVEVGIPAELPLPGASTSQLKVIEETYSGNSLTLMLEGEAGSAYNLPLRVNETTAGKLVVEGGNISPGMLVDLSPRLETWFSQGGFQVSDNATLRGLHIEFPAGAGYQRQTVHVTW